MRSNKPSISHLHAAAVREYHRGNIADAKIIVESALQRAPQNVPLLDLSGVIKLYSEGHDSGAKALFLKALKIDPGYYRAVNNLGSLYWTAGDVTRAKESFKKVISMKQNIMSPYRNLANIYLQEKDLPAANQIMRMCVQHNPDKLKARMHLAWVLELMSLYQEAIKEYEEIIRIKPDYPYAHFNRGLVNLKLGEHEKGWQGYEWRYLQRHRQVPDISKWGSSEWNGESIKGKTLLIIEEQGFGDAIQMARYVPELIESGANVILRCRPRLKTLFKLIPNLEKVKNSRYSISRMTHKCDYHIPMMSLPRVFGTEFSSINTAIPYLYTDPHKVDHWKNRIDPGKFNVGIVWTGNAEQRGNAHRSCELQDYLPLSSIPGVRLYSLQKGADDAKNEQLFSQMNVVDFMSEIVDFLDTACLIECLDLVITVDTSVAHLAGAIGHPTWAILGKNHCWRYSLKHTYNPWYPHMRLFRQTQLDDWADVIQAVALALESEVSHKQLT